MSRKSWTVFWLAALLLLFVFNGSLLITDSVESNYALTAKEMVVSGDWLSPQIYGQYWFDKPVFFYWLTALGFKIFGFTEFAARFFPSCFGLAGLGLLIWGAKKLFDDKTAFYSGLVLLTSVEFLLISKSVITDAILFFFFSAVLLFFYLGYSTPQKKYYYVMYAGAALATLTKGPIGFLLPGLIIFLFLAVTKSWQELKQMKLCSGTLLFLIIGLPWYLAMISLHGDAFTKTFLGTHNLLRATVSEHPRDNVIYYYTLVNILALFPWSGFLPQCLWQKFRKQGSWQRPDDLTVFLLLWAAIVFVFFQNMATKYITYTYPLLFPAALLLGRYLAVKGSRVFSRGYLLFHGLFYAVLAGAVYWCRFKGIAPVQDEFLVLLTALAGLGLVYAVKSCNKKYLTAAVAAMALFFNLALIPTVAVPLSGLRSGKQLALQLQNKYPEKAEIGLYGEYPTSAVFYSGKKLVKLLPQDEIEGFKPKAFSWSSKNVMPYAELKSYAGVKDNVVVVQRKALQGFMDNADTYLLLAGENKGWYIVQG